MELRDAKVKDVESIERAQQRKTESKKDKGPKDLIISIMRLVGWLTIIIGIIYGVQGRLFSEVYIIFGLICGILIVGLAEVIDLLQKIYLNTRK